MLIRTGVLALASCLAVVSCSGEGLVRPSGDVIAEPLSLVDEGDISRLTGRLYGDREDTLTLSSCGPRPMMGPEILVGDEWVPVFQASCFASDAGTTALHPGDTLETFILIPNDQLDPGRAIRFNVAVLEWGGEPPEIAMLPLRY